MEENKRNFAIRCEKLSRFLLKCMDTKEPSPAVWGAVLSSIAAALINSQDNPEAAFNNFIKAVTKMRDCEEESCTKTNT